jgi:hypothetical protein
VLLGGGATWSANGGSGKGVISVSRPAGGTSTTKWEASAALIVAQNGNHELGVIAYAICSG